jgi:hypothetical protein
VELHALGVQVTAELEGQFKTVAYDARGWGKSDKTHGIYKALMFEAMLQAVSMQMQTAVAVVEPDFNGKPFLEALGFVDVGAQCWLDDHFLAQPIQCELLYNSYIWSGGKECTGRISHP